MKWMQFFTPVESITWDEAEKLVAEHLQGDQGDVVFLDVRQQSEYHDGHLPGAKLVPLGELDNRLGELVPDQPTVIY